MKTKDTDEYKRVNAIFIKHGVRLDEAMFGTGRRELPKECSNALYDLEKLLMPSMTAEERNLHQWHIDKEARLAKRQQPASNPHFEGLKFSHQLGKAVV